MPTPKRIEQLLDLLLERTNDGALKWQTTADEYTFRLASRAANVRVTRSEEYDREKGAPYIVRRLSVTSELGRVIEEYSPAAPQDQARFDLLFSEARRSASNTGEVLDKLMKELAKGA
jgi:hypothetical protein